MIGHGNRATGSSGSRHAWRRTVALALVGLGATAGAGQPSAHPILVHAARLLEVDTGRILMPGEILVAGERISAVGPSLVRPDGAEVIDLGDTTLMPGLIDAHVHLFLHPGNDERARR